ncbi:MAG: hypothetical protein DLM53_12480 [Candidatus Eremiobacter antarcticus]|nr:hypothetical protein [Candidatus Eremiobacteraeota bacterium]MBC5808848.1 hypothetical protein [Candidatus Eremiobacteraeota bacterium]PZR60465.1 MAG: hypothetical protein DLM53_12480 [Candidatus Eremiobacter sp. RRmetagenome_bin22]
MTRPRVLFICVQNSARSQIAEAWANKFCAGALEAQSVGSGALTSAPSQFSRRSGVGNSELRYLSAAFTRRWQLCAKSRDGNNYA